MLHLWTREKTFLRSLTFDAILGGPRRNGISRSALVHSAPTNTMCMSRLFVLHSQPIRWSDAKSEIRRSLRCCYSLLLTKRIAASVDHNGGIWKRRCHSYWRIKCLGLSAGTRKLCSFGYLELVFIWSCFVSCLLFPLFYVSWRNLGSDTHRRNRIFFVHTTPKELENATESLATLDLWLKKNRVGKSHYLFIYFIYLFS